MPYDVTQILNPNVGINQVMPPVGESHIPQAKQLPSTTITERGLDELYNFSTTEKFLEQTLCPKVGDGTILQPNVFSDCLKNALKSLQNNPQSQVQTFVREELTPLLENEMLLQAYSGLLIGG